MTWHSDTKSRAEPVLYSLAVLINTQLRGGRLEANIGFYSN